MENYVSPSFDESAFNCPICGAYSHMRWADLTYSPGLREYPGRPKHRTPLKLAMCARCKHSSYWMEFTNEEEGKTEPIMLYPFVGSGPIPHKDMPDSVRKNYEEARQIAARSPRGAGALLRLAIQHLCIDLGEKGENLNHDVGNLVKKGLPATVQQALDSVRVIGNDAVHPGKLSDGELPERIQILFECINHIVQYLISQPREMGTLYENLPESKREAIKKRDGKALNSEAK